MILALWLACFASFGWATQAHFVNRGVYTRGMRWTLGLGSLFALLQGAAALTRPFSAAAALFYAASLALFWWTIGATRGKGFGACHASIESSELVTAGPYRFIRHPFYASYSLAWLAGGCLYPPLFAAVAAMGCLYWRAAVEEEKRFLEGPKGEAYKAYRKATRHFF